MKNNENKRKIEQLQFNMVFIAKDSMGSMIQAITFYWK